MENPRKLTKAVTAAAIAWWEGRRPRGWSLEKHLNNPCVNVQLADAGLACAIAAFLTWQELDASKGGSFYVDASLS